MFPLKIFVYKRKFPRNSIDALKTCSLCGAENASDAVYCKMDTHLIQESELASSQVPSPELSSKFKKSFFPLRNYWNMLFKSKPSKIDSELNRVNPQILEKGTDASSVQVKITETAKTEISPNILNRDLKNPDRVPKKTLDLNSRTDFLTEMLTLIQKNKIPKTPILSDPEDKQSYQAKNIYSDEDKKPRLLQQEEEAKSGSYAEKITLNSEKTEDLQITEAIKSADDEATTKPAKKKRWLWPVTTVASLLLLFTMVCWYYPKISPLKKIPFFSFLLSGDKKETVSPQVPISSDGSRKTSPQLPETDHGDRQHPVVAIKMSEEDKNILTREAGTLTAKNKPLSSRASIANTTKGPKKIIAKRNPETMNSAKSKDEIRSINDQKRIAPSKNSSNTSLENQDMLEDQINLALKKEGFKELTAVAGNDQSIIVRGAVKNLEIKQSAIDIALSLAGEKKVKDMIFIVQP